MSVKPVTLQLGRHGHRLPSPIDFTYRGQIFTLFASCLQMTSNACLQPPITALFRQHQSLSLNHLPQTSSPPHQPSKEGLLHPHLPHRPLNRSFPFPSYLNPRIPFRSLRGIPHLQTRQILLPPHSRGRNGIRPLRVDFQE